MTRTLKAGCKVNLNLRITGVRADGYHTLDSLFWPLPEPHDTLHCTPAQGKHIAVECTSAHIDPHNNTLTRAYTAYTKATGYAPGLHILLEKGIPTGAGLGGGSADAAGLLYYLQDNAPKPLTPRALHTLAISIGADVPFFLRNIPCHVRGIGDILTPCSPTERALFTGLTLVCLCPKVHIATPWAYTAWDTAQQYSQDKNTPFCLTMPTDKAKETDPRMTHLVNDFEPVVFAHYPQLRALKERLLRQGAAAVVMSGSGSCLVGLFRGTASAQSTGLDDCTVYLNTL